MPTLSEDEMDALRAELAGPAYADMTDLGRFAALHAASPIPNPVTQRPAVPKPFVYADVQALLSSASQGRLASVAFLPRILDDIQAQNRPGMVGWADILVNSSTITTSEHDAIVGLMHAVVPDPGWTATVPGGPSPKERLFGGKAWTLADGSRTTSIPLDDVAEARRP